MDETERGIVRALHAAFGKLADVEEPGTVERLRKENAAMRKTLLELAGILTNHIHVRDEPDALTDVLVDALERYKP